ASKAAATEVAAAAHAAAEVTAAHATHAAKAHAAAAHAGPRVAEAVRVGEPAFGERLPLGERLLRLCIELLGLRAEIIAAAGIAIGTLVLHRHVHHLAIAGRVHAATDRHRGHPCAV